METWEQELRALVDNFLSRSGMAPSSFGAAAVGDRGLVTRLRAGKAVTVPTADRIRQFIANHALSAADKPPEVAGPAQAADAGGEGLSGGAAAGQGAEAGRGAAGQISEGVGS